MKKLTLSFTLLLTTTIFAQVPSYVPTNGLVGWWPFNGNANDESGNGNNGFINGAVLTTNRFGIDSSAFYFDGIDDGIYMAPIGLPLGNSPRTISSWFKTNAGSIQTSQYPNLQSISGYGSALGGPVVFVQWVQAPSGKAYFMSGSWQNEIFSNYAVNNGIWHNCVLTYGGVGSSVKIYIDGALQSSTGNIILNTPLSNFGVGNITIANCPFLGEIDDVAIWNRELSQCEITNLFSTSVVSAGPDLNVCQGLPVTLTASGATTYLWNNSVINGQGFTPTTTQNYVVTGTINGCTLTDTVKVTVNPIPLILAGNDQSICSGDLITLSASGGAIYTWDNNVINSQAFIPTTTQTYIVTGTDTLGCVGSDTVQITVLATSLTSQPQDQNVPTSIGTANFSVSSSSSNTLYQWQTNLGLGFQNLSNAGQYSGVTSSTLSVSNLSMTNNNQVFRCLINDAGCTDTTTIATLTIIDDASILETDFPLISISPNPTAGDFTIAGLELYNNISSMRVSDVNGKLVKELDPTASKFTLGTVKPGVYFLMITAEDKQEVIKIIKE